MTYQPLNKMRKGEGKLYGEEYWREQLPFTYRFDTPTPQHIRRNSNKYEI